MIQNGMIKKRWGKGAAGERRVKGMQIKAEKKVSGDGSRDGGRRGQWEEENRGEEYKAADN